MSRSSWILLCVALAACDGKETGDGEPAAGSTGGDEGSTSAAMATTEPTPATSADDGGSSEDGPAETGTPPEGGCGVDPGLAGAVPGQVDVDGVARQFLLVVPDDYDPDRAYPFVFMFHGRGGDGGQFRSYNRVEEAGAGEAIFVYPDALPNEQQGGLTGWDLSPNGIDVAFMDKLLADFTANLCIDEERIFATGHSHGGFFSNAMGCARGDIMRAIAPVAGGGPGAGCQEGSVAAWLAHHPDDPTVPVDLGKIARNHWLEANDCGEETEPTDPDPCVVYQGCAEGHEVVWCEHTDESQGIGPHGWPAFAGDAIWSFFSGY